MYMCVCVYVLCVCVCVCVYTCMYIEGMNEWNGNEYESEQPVSGLITSLWRCVQTSKEFLGLY